MPSPLLAGRSTLHLCEREVQNTRLWVLSLISIREEEWSVKLEYYKESDMTENLGLQKISARDYWAENRGLEHTSLKVRVEASAGSEINFFNCLPVISLV